MFIRCNKLFKKINISGLRSGLIGCDDFMEHMFEIEGCSYSLVGLFLFEEPFEN